MLTTAEVREVCKRAAERHGMKFVDRPLHGALGGPAGLLAIGRFGPLRPPPPPRPPAAEFKDAGANI